MFDLEASSNKVKQDLKYMLNKKIRTMTDIKSDIVSEGVGQKFRIIVGSLAILLNGLVFVWYFFFSGLR